MQYFLFHGWLEPCCMMEFICHEDKLWILMSYIVILAPLKAYKFNGVRLYFHVHWMLVVDVY